MSFDASFDFADLISKLNSLKASIPDDNSGSSNYQLANIRVALDQCNKIVALDSNQKLILYNKWNQNNKPAYKYMANLVDSYDLLLDPNDDSLNKLKNSKPGEVMRWSGCENPLVLDILKPK